MIALILAAITFLTPPATPANQPIQNEIVIPPNTDSLNVMFVASKGGRRYKILSPIQFQKELNKCLLLHIQEFDTQEGPLIIFNCEESK